MSKRKLTNLEQQILKLQQQLEKKKEKLKKLKRLKSETYRKLEAQFLIGFGRTVIKNSLIKKMETENGKQIKVLTVNAETLKDLLNEEKFNDISELNEEFKNFKEKLLKD